MQPQSVTVLSPLNAEEGNSKMAGEKTIIKSRADQAATLSALIKELEEMPLYYPDRKAQAEGIIERQQKLLDFMARTWNNRDRLLAEWKGRLKILNDEQAEQIRAGKLGLSTAQLKSKLAKREKLMAMLAKTSDDESEIIEG